jgi:Fe-S cluster assembly protein SufD
MKQIILDLKNKNIDLEITEDSEIFGIFIGTGKQFVDCLINFRHLQPHIQSKALIKAVLFDQAKFNVTCNLIIAKGAKETDGYFKIETLILSDQASAKVIPSLEIMEDDVKGGHGATVGKVNRDQLHYLLSRGLNAKEAEKIIVYGFINEVLEKIKDATIKAEYLKLLDNV